jgi:murein DD-endopeptidase MepM/ murein hydrolase activator NlpD
MSSPYGKRNTISTSKGNTASFHNGTDYATYGVKLAQYAIEDGTILSCGTDWKNGGAKYVWVKYGRIGVKMLHYHLDSINVKKGQRVTKNTILGYTGKTGKATGIHLHLEVVSLATGKRYDPEAYSEKYREPTNQVETSAKAFLGGKGYLSKGDENNNVGKIAKFMRANFKAYTSKKALGNYFGPYLEKAIREFQSRTKIEVDGRVGPITLEKLVEYGFEY